MPEIRTLLVDDEPDVRLVMRLAIESEDDTEVNVVGEAEDGQQALSQMDDLDPSVVVIDLRMPHLDGLTTASRMLDARPDLAIILCSAHCDRELQYEARALGVAACVSKTDLVEIPTLIKQVVRLPD